MFAAVHDTPYDILLVLHILTGVIAFAPAFTHPALATKMRRDGFTERSTVIGHMSSFGMRRYGAALILSGLLGFGVAGLSDGVFKMSQGWLMAAFVVWIAMNGVLHAGVLPAERAIAAAGTVIDETAEKKLAVAGTLLTVLFVVQLYLMVFKPVF